MDKSEVLLFKLRHQWAEQVWKSVTALNNGVKTNTADTHAGYRGTLCLEHRCVSVFSLI